MISFKGVGYQPATISIDNTEPYARSEQHTLKITITPHSGDACAVTLERTEAAVLLYYLKAVLDG